VIVARLLASTGDPLGPVDQDPDAVREEACKLVSSNPSVCSPPKPPPSKSGDGSGFDLSFVSMLLWVLLVVAVLALLYLLVRWVATARGGGRRRRDEVSDEAADDDIVERDAVAIDRSREPTNWRSDAYEHRRAGRYRDALRCCYRALVGDLARRVLIDDIPGRTTGEERAQLRRVTPSASEQFDSAADLFDAAWYGDDEVGAADDDRFQWLEQRVLAATAEVRR